MRKAKALIRALCVSVSFHISATDTTAASGAPPRGSFLKAVFFLFNLYLLGRKEREDDHSLGRGRVFVGDGKIFEQGAVLVNGERIRKVSEGEIPIPKDARRIPLEGQTLLPGFIDCHVYLCLDGSPDRVGALAPGRAPLTTLKAAQFARRTLLAGVRVAMGTDAGTPSNMHGENLGELKRLVEAGYSPVEAVRAATQIAAKVLGLENDLGTIEEGKLADLVVVEGNPLEDVGLLLRREAIRLVMQGGKLVKGEW